MRGGVVFLIPTLAALLRIKYANNLQSYYMETPGQLHLTAFVGIAAGGGVVNPSSNVLLDTMISGCGGYYCPGSIPA